MGRKLFNCVSAVSLVLGLGFAAFSLGVSERSEGGGTYWLGWRMDRLSALGRPMGRGNTLNAAMLILAASAVTPAVWLLEYLCRVPGSTRRLRRANAGLCETCGYDIRASAERCPECGAPVNTPEPEISPPRLPPSAARRATVSLMVGIAVVTAGMVALYLPPRDASIGGEYLKTIGVILFLVAPTIGARLGVLALRVPGSHHVGALAGVAMNAVMIAAALLSLCFLFEHV